MEHDQENQDSEKDQRMKKLRSYEAISDDDSDDDDEENERDERPPLRIFETLKVDKESDDEEAEPEPQTIAELIEKYTEPEDDSEVEAAEEAEESTEALENLTDEEAVMVVQEHLDNRAGELDQEISDAQQGSTEAVKAKVNAEFVDKLKNNLETSDKAPKEVIEDTAEEIIEEFDIEPTDESEESAEVVEAAAEAPDDDDDTLSIPTTPPPPPNPLTPITPPSPPIPPAPPIPPTPAPSPVGPPGGPNLPPLNPINTVGNFASAAPNVLNQATPESAEDTHSRALDALAGGVVGYLIGRRRGRIKTEAKMQPVQESLEKQVKDLQNEVTDKEQQIRQMTAEKIKNEGEPARENLMQKVFDQKEPEPKPVVETAPMPNVEIQQEEPAFEAAKNPEPEYRAAERIFSQSIEGQPLAQNLAREAIREIPDSEIIKIAANIEIQGTTAKALYEQGRIEKQDLKQAVMEMVSGGNPERIIVERLKPVAETMEILPRESTTSAAQAQGAGSVGSAYAPPFQTSQGQNQMTPQQADEAANRILNNQPPAKPNTPTQAYVWIAVSVVIVLVIAGIFLF